MDLQGRSHLLKEYQMGKTIGQGAFSKVKLGYHRETGQKVAIKIIDKRVMAEKAKKSKKAHEDREKRPKSKAVEMDKSDSNSIVNTQYPDEEYSMKGYDYNPEQPLSEQIDFVSKLQLEVQLMLRLEHPNIVTVYQVINSDEECFIIMEYASGGELIEYIASRDHLSEKEARKFFRQIISAIDHCHLANVVHRDLKLENLLLNAEKNILLSDFGLGRTFRDDLEEYMKTFCGTPNYAAVELISGIPYVGVKSDIWAMGVVLYLMVTGKPPFYGETISLLYKEIKAVNYKVYDTFSKELRHLMTRMLCKNPAQRITMDELRDHPWVNYEEPETPLRIHPRLKGNVEPSALGQFILGIEYNFGTTVYRFHEHKKPEKSFSAFASKSKSVQHKRANTVCQDNKIGSNSKDFKAAIAEPTKTNIPDQMPEKRSTFAFFRRISVSIPESNSSKIVELPPKTTQNTLPPIPSAATKNVNVVAQVQKKESQEVEPPMNPPLRRHSTLGPNPPKAGDNPEKIQKPQSGHFLSALSAMLKKSSSSITPMIVSPPDNTLSSNGNIGKSPEPIYPTSPHGSRLIRSATFSAANPEIQVPEVQNSPHSEQHSPLIPPSTSIRQLRLASHLPLIQRRESFGARELTVQTTAKPDKLLVPGDDMTRLGLGEKLRKEISKSYHASLSTGDERLPHGRTEIMKSAILGNIGRQVSDSDDRLGSHDMMSITSRYTEGISNSDHDESNSTQYDGEQDVEHWKDLHSPAKTIRSMRFTFNRGTSSTLDPAEIFRRLTLTLNKLNHLRQNNLAYSRTNRDYYMIVCKFRNPFTTVEDPVIFEVEVCKVWLLKMHGLRIKRIAGSPLLFKEIYTFLESELAI